MDSLTAYGVGVALCLWQANSRRRVGLVAYSTAMVITGVGAATLELDEHYLASLAAGLVYAVLYIKSEVTIIRHGLDRA